MQKRQLYYELSAISVVLGQNTLFAIQFIFSAMNYDGKYMERKQLELAKIQNCILRSIHS